MKVTVLGAGGWGIAIALLLNKNGHDVTLWSAVESEVLLVNNDRENKRCLPGVRIPEEITISGDMGPSVEGAEVIVMAVASVYVRATAKTLSAYYKPGQIIVDLAKGIEDDTLYTMVDIISQEVKGADVAILSGPTHAEEVSRGIPTSCVVGATSKATAEKLQSVFMSDVFRVYTSSDILGIELGGSLKNVIALAAGMADGLGYGDNSKAALITRGMAEIARLGIAMGGKSETFYGLSGIGDLIVTCASMHSRNRRAGILMGQGYSMEDAMKEVNMVVEGVYSAKAALKLAKKYNIVMPIVEQVNLILFEGKPAGEAVNELMQRDKTIEHSSLNW